VNGAGGLPPGPRGALWQTARYLRNPSAFYLRCARDHGDTFTVPSVLGPVVCIHRPAHLRQLFALAGEDFSHWNEALVTPMLGPSSVMVTSGERHLRQRRMLAPMFRTRREDLASLAERVAKTALEHAARWPVGARFRLQERLIALSMDVILESILGVTDAARVQAYRSAISRTLRAMGPATMIARVVHARLAAVAYRRFLRERGRLDALLYAEIDARSAGEWRRVCDEQGVPPPREELRDQLITFILAGHDTTAVALAWAIYWLARHPAALERVQGEVEGASDLLSLPYLDAVCRESLRLHPTVPEVIRKLRVPLALEDAGVLPAGTAVAACIVAAHRRPGLYARPAEFIPERFLERRYAAHEFLPFGGGTHRCVGEVFAMLELKVILASLLRRLRFELAGQREETPRLRSIIMEPRGGVAVRAYPR
jgi:cytochrome P450